LIFSAEAAAQVDALRRHYQKGNRIEAVRNLIPTRRSVDPLAFRLSARREAAGTRSRLPQAGIIRALAQAEISIERDPAAGLSAPRPYPNLASAGRVWTKSGRYWIAHTITRPPVVLGVFYEAADIPNRI